MQHDKGIDLFDRSNSLFAGLQPAFFILVISLGLFEYGFSVGHPVASARERFVVIMNDTVSKNVSKVG